jgi:voltage-gated potassium channel
VDKKKVKLGAGQFFGEVAVLRGERRSGTATALSRTNLLALSAQDLHALMKRDSRIAKRIKDVVEKRTGKKVRPSKTAPYKAK